MTPAGLHEALLIGSWNLRSWDRQIVATGQAGPARGPARRGSLVYLPGGRMITLIIQRDRPLPAAMPPTTEEKAALYDGMLAYSGRWRLDGDVVVHRIETAWNGVWSGSEQRRHAVLEGSMLTLRTPAFIEPLTGQEAVHTLVFQRDG
ncbi:lipocalin-like domain-containing protein [Roseomonas sp. CAU 1739]|uniref:lipocalin-like domain-containing protein n=1 Tax=Roseomonas sp. CAU 1739 TaxID=3140364 RepID=UPI00325A7D3D